MVIIAIVLVALMAFAGLAIDGGRLFANRRQTQNAADTAALAGANVLNRYLLDVTGTVTADQVWTAVSGTATSNGMDATKLTCYYVYLDLNGNPVPADNKTACSSYSGHTVPTNASGVEVVPLDTQKTLFLNAVGNANFTTTADAAAAVEATTQVPTLGTSDILVCAVSSSDPRSGGTGLQTTGGADIPIILVGQNTINPAAVGQTYPIKGNAVDKTCGTNGNFKGLVCKPQDEPCPDYGLPGYWASAPGNHSGPFRNNLSAACDGTTIGCIFSLPLCYDGAFGPAPSTNDFYCVTFGSFEITSTTANSDNATFLGGATVGSGQGSGSGGPPPNNQTRIVKLVK
jgi:hypothetical protein